MNTIDLAVEPIFDKMVEILDKKSARYNREFLKQYIEMKVATQKTVDKNPRATLKRRTNDKSKLKIDTVKNWVDIFLFRYRD